MWIWCSSAWMCFAIYCRSTPCQRRHGSPYFRDITIPRDIANLLFNVVSYSARLRIALDLQLNAKFHMRIPVCKCSNGFLQDITHRSLSQIGENTGVPENCGAGCLHTSMASLICAVRRLDTLRRLSKCEYCVGLRGRSPSKPHTGGFLGDIAEVMFFMEIWFQKESRFCGLWLCA
jgi:hypothetical protein